MQLVHLLSGAAVAVVAGLDRTAILQGMVCRPLVAAPLTGWLLGQPLVGLEVGALLELLWLSRLPVGASVPHDDTQVAVGATVLALGMGAQLGQAGHAFTLLSLLLALPLGKVGQQFDRLARERNYRLVVRATAALAAGDLERAERSHLGGLFNFAAASLLGYLTVVGVGALALTWTAPLLLVATAAAGEWLRLVLVLVGGAALINTLNLRRSLVLFTVAFVGALLLFWLVGMS